MVHSAPILGKGWWVYAPREATSVREWLPTLRIGMATRMGSFGWAMIGETVRAGRTVLSGTIRLVGDLGKLGHTRPVGQLLRPVAGCHFPH